jgi:hypothetical protein|nr:MAG TPA: hypothetical protein [Caudoviricetes sp.]
MTNESIITKLGYEVEKTISGYYRLVRDEEIIFDDSACEELNEDEDTAEAFFEAYLQEYAKEYNVDYKNYNVHVVEDEAYYHIDFGTGAGEAHYPKKDWSLDSTLEDQYNLDNE